MTDKDNRMLMDAILDYEGWVKSREGQRGTRSNLRYTHILTDFVIYVIHKGMVWKEMFSLKTFEAFQVYSGYRGAYRALRALSDYLFTQGRIDRPLQISKPDSPLPDLYERYLLYLLQTLQPSAGYVRQSRRILSLLHGYLQRHNIHLPALKIEHLDAFMASFKVTQNTRKIYRSYLRGFLKYLYHERKVMRRDLAPCLWAPLSLPGESRPDFYDQNRLKNSLIPWRLLPPLRGEPMPWCTWLTLWA